jgi:hypothetical protein
MAKQKKEPQLKKGIRELRKATQEQMLRENELAYRIAELEKKLEG